MAKQIRRKPVTRRKTTKKKTFFSGKMIGFTITFLIVLFIGVTAYHYRDALAYYFSFKSKHQTEKNATKVEEARIFQVLKRHEKKVFGFDVSEYQGKISWEEIKTIEDTFQLKFVFIRATAGKDKVDSRFKQNWKDAKENSFIRGAYHYYRPNENSIQQATNFIKTVKLQKGDFPPVLDIENLPKTQSIDSLKVGLKRWLTKVENHYNVKPIIYSGESYYKDFLEKEFKGYTFWIANYNFFVEDIKDHWAFWQFTEKGTVPGIQGPVDVNIYNGTPKMLNYMVLQ
ncbi:glycoside hydrolase family 25 protein [Flavobacterium lacus]|jgi:lysozyme|uniref:Lysozyme n=1 Tax=Flavobacterium lacus TaxID=1353778 RepID=A0A328WK88_9FLAO|nr:glycoside hydrolase family 25 protein [Flavobacterium lacus]RAR46623.1 lysozyme [Flavobacterium lacus]